MLETNYLEYPASIQEAMGMQVDYAKLFPIYIAEQTGEGVISVTSDKQAYASGSPFYLTILLEEGYELEELSVVDNNDNEIELTKESETELSDGSIEIIMFGIMGIGAQFINAAGARGKKQFTLMADEADASVVISCSGDLSVISIKNGVVVTQNYENIENTKVSVESDANTLIKFVGDVTKIVLNEETWGQYVTEINTKKLPNLEYLDLGYQSKITNIDVTKNTSLLHLLLQSTGISSIDLSNNVSLESFSCNDTNIETLDLRSNTLLTYVEIGIIYNITKIYYQATNNNVSTGVADAITNATSTTGTVYTDSAAAYYQTIADAATAKGWTIEQL